MDQLNGKQSLTTTALFTLQSTLKCVHVKELNCFLYQPVHFPSFPIFILCFFLFENRFFPNVSPSGFVRGKRVSFPSDEAGRRNVRKKTIFSNKKLNSLGIFFSFCHARSFFFFLFFNVVPSSAHFHVAGPDKWLRGP